MSDQKPLSKQNLTELAASAAEVGVEIPDGATKTQIVEQIEKQRAAAEAGADQAAELEAEQAADDVAGEPPAPASPDEVEALEDPADQVDQDVSDPDDESGLVTITREITEFAGNGDWVDPFSGLRVHHGSQACVQSGAVRQDDDTAIVRVTAERAAELGA